MSDHIETLMMILRGVEMDLHCLDDGQARIDALDAAIVALRTPQPVPEFVPPICRDAACAAAGTQHDYCTPQPVTPAGGEVEPFGYFDSQGLSHAGNSTNFRWLLEQHRAGKPNWGDLKLLYTPPPVADAALDAEKLGAFVASILNLDEDYIGDVDGGTLQDTAEEFGLLQATEVTEACGEGCNCAGYGDFPQTCYRPTETMRRAIAALNQRGGGA